MYVSGLKGDQYLLRKDQRCHKDRQIFLKGPAPFFVGAGNTQIRNRERLGDLRLNPQALCGVSLWSDNKMSLGFLFPLHTHVVMSSVPG